MASSLLYGSPIPADYTAPPSPPQPTRHPIMIIKKNLLTVLGTAALSTSLLACSADYSLEEVNACEQGVAASSDPTDYEFKARAAVATVNTGHHARLRFKSDAFRSGSKTLDIADGALDFGFRDTVKAVC